MTEEIRTLILDLLYEELEVRAHFEESTVLVEEAICWMEKDLGLQDHKND